MKSLDALELGLQMVMNHLVSTWNLGQVLFNSGKACNLQCPPEDFLKNY